MSLLSRLNYYFVTMRRQQFSEVECTLCGAIDKKKILNFDRYLLPVTVSICKSCSMVYTSHNVTGQNLQKFYRDDYRRFYENAAIIDNDYIYMHKPKLNAAYRMQRIKQVVPDFDSVMEIGSGQGYFLDECRALGVKNLIGLEPGDTFRQYSQNVLGLDCIIGSPFEKVTDLPFVPRLVVMFHVLEHVEDPVSCLRWIRERISPDGNLVIEVPDITGDWSKLGLGNFHIAHRSYFSPRTLYNAMAKAGWEPFLVTRDDGDGIYRGNLRMVARPAAFTERLEMPSDDLTVLYSSIKAKLSISSLHKGWPRAALRLLKQAVRSK